MPTPKPRPSLTYDFFSSSLRKQLRIVLNQFFGIFLQPDDHFLLHLDVQIDLDGLVRGLHLYAARKPHYCSQHHAQIGNYRSKFICLHRSEEHTSELQSLMRISYAVFCLKKKKKKITTRDINCTH